MRLTPGGCSIVALVAFLFGACNPAPVTGRRAPPAAVVQDGGQDGGQDRGQDRGLTAAEPDAAVGILVDAFTSDATAPAVDAAPASDAVSGKDPSARADGASPADASAVASADSSTGADSARDGAAPDVGAPGDARSASGDATSDAAAARAPRAGEIAIVEVLANPNGQDLGREWIEVLSLAREPLSLSELYVADGTTDVPVAAGVIPSGARVVIGQSTDPAKNGGAAVGAAYGTHLILNNDDEQISICVGPCATGLVVDRVAWGTLGTPYDGHAIVVDPGTQAICPALEPFGTAGDFGTPGQPNPPCGTPDAGAGEGPPGFASSSG